MGPRGPGGTHKITVSVIAVTSTRGRNGLNARRHNDAACEPEDKGEDDEEWKGEVEGRHCMGGYRPGACAMQGPVGAEFRAGFRGFICISLIVDRSVDRRQKYVPYRHHYLGPACIGWNRIPG